MLNYDDSFRSQSNRSGFETRAAPRSRLPPRASQSNRSGFETVLHFLPRGGSDGSQSNRSGFETINIFGCIESIERSQSNRSGFETHLLCPRRSRLGCLNPTVVVLKQIVDDEVERVFVESQSNRSGFETCAVVFACNCFHSSQSNRSGFETHKEHEGLQDQSRVSIQP